MSSSGSHSDVCRRQVPTAGVGFTSSFNTAQGENTHVSETVVDFGIDRGGICRRIIHYNGSGAGTA
jgi:hypothetical protein